MIKKICKLFFILSLCSLMTSKITAMNTIGQEIANIQLLECTELGDLEGVRIALANGADIETCDETGMTTLYIACLQGQTSIIKELLECGASLDSADIMGVQPFDMVFVSEQCPKEVVALLLSHAQKQNAYTPEDLNEFYNRAIDQSYLQAVEAFSDHLPLGTDNIGNGILTLSKKQKQRQRILHHQIPRSTTKKFTRKRLACAAHQLAIIRTQQPRFKARRTLQVLLKRYVTNSGPIDPDLTKSFMLDYASEEGKPVRKNIEKLLQSVVHQVIQERTGNPNIIAYLKHRKLYGR